MEGILFVLILWSASICVCCVRLCLMWRLISFRTTEDRAAFALLVVVVVVLAPFAALIWAASCVERSRRNDDDEH